MVVRARTDVSGIFFACYWAEDKLLTHHSFCIQPSAECSRIMSTNRVAMGSAPSASDGTSVWLPSQTLIGVTPGIRPYVASPYAIATIF